MIFFLVRPMQEIKVYEWTIRTSRQKIVPIRVLHQSSSTSFDVSFHAALDARGSEDVTCRVAQLVGVRRVVMAVSPEDNGMKLYGNYTDLPPCPPSLEHYPIESPQEYFCEK